MWQWLQQLQQRSKGYRQRVAFSGALVATGIVVVVWAVSLPERFTVLTANLDDRPVEADVEVQGFLSGVREQVAAVAASLSALRASDETAGEVSATTIATSTEELVEATTTERGIEIPTLTSSTVRQLNPRPVQIATSSATTQ